MLPYVAVYAMCILSLKAFVVFYICNVLVVSNSLVRYFLRRYMVNMNLCILLGNDYPLQNLLYFIAMVFSSSSVFFLFVIWRLDLLFLFLSCFFCNLFVLIPFYVKAFLAYWLNGASYLQKLIEGSIGFRVWYCDGSISWHQFVGLISLGRGSIK